MFGFISDIFYLLIFEPLFNFLIAILNLIPYSNLGAGIIIVTLVIRFILYPSFKKSLEVQKKIAEIRPQLKKIEKEHKDDRQKRAEAQMALYKEHKINPFSSLLFPLFVQLPILFGLYKIFTVDFFNNGASEHLYSLVSYPESIGIYFLTINLTEPSFIIAAVAAVIQYLQARSMTNFQASRQDKTDDGSKEQDVQKSMNLVMLYVLPIAILVIGTGIPAIGFEGLPAGVSLYWAIATAFALWQQNKLYNEQ